MKIIPRATLWLNAMGNTTLVGLYLATVKPELTIAALGECSHFFIIKNIVTAQLKLNMSWEWPDNGYEPTTPPDKLCVVFVELQVEQQLETTPSC